MPQANADRNLLFGILAMQMDFITRDHLVAAMQAWVFSKATPLGQILRNQGVLAKDTHALLEALVAKHLQQHGDDAEKSLAAVGSTGSFREQLKQVADADLQASLVHVSTAKKEDDDPYMTRAPSVGSSSSSGARFRILRPHARGGLGEVLIARDEELHREVALKQIQDRHADNRESQARFLLEAEITGGLEHPGIVPVYSMGQYADGRPYYAMRFIKGDSLKEAIESFHKADLPGRDPGERSLQLRNLLGRFVDVCNAIAYAHSRGVLHRDLKPGNIMLGKYGETLVVDWGLAKPSDGSAEISAASDEGTLTLSSGSLASHTLMGAVVGTPQFMSPEQAAGRLDQLGPASDVYSLGATLYCLMTGIPPISDPDVGMLLQKVQRGQFSPPRQIKANIPQALEAICLKAMALAPADRYPSTRALADDIEHWLADEPVSAWREPWTARARRWMGRHRTLVAGTATAVLAAGLVFGIATVLLTAANEREKSARTLAQEKEREAKVQRDEARKQTEMAEHNYRLARTAVDRYHTEVSESVLLHEPGMQPLRKKLLEAAREFYEQFVREHADDPKLRGELGKAFFRLAQITGDIGSELEAIALHKQAQHIFAILDADQPGDAEVQSDLAKCLHHLGRLYRRTDQLSESEIAYKAALSIWDSLVAPPGPANRYRADQARSQLGLGNVDEVTGRLDEARLVYQTALATREKLAKESPKVAEYQRDLAISRHNLAMVFSALGNNEQAEKSYLDAAEIQKKLVAEYPHISQYQNDLARTLYNLGDGYAQAKQGQKAEASYQEAERLWTALTGKYPDDADFQTNLAEVVDARAAAYSSAGETAKAEETGLRALSFKQKLADGHPGIPRFQGDLAKAHFRLGNIYRTGGKLPQAEGAFEKAIGILKPLVEGHPDLPQYQNDLARCRNDLGLAFVSSDDKSKAEREFREALRLWERLHAAHPKELEFSLGVSTASYNLGNFSRKNGDLKAALESYSRAVAALPALDKTKTGAAGVRTALRNAHWKRAEAWTQSGQPEKALEDWDRALELAGDSQRPWFRLYRTRALGRAGLYLRADEEAIALEKDAKNSGEALYELARAYALCAAAAAKDSKLKEEERRQFSDRYAARSMQFLTEARAAGYFKHRPNLDKLTEDTDLDALRSRLEFKKWQSEVAEDGKRVVKPS